MGIEPPRNVVSPRSGRQYRMTVSCDGVHPPHCFRTQSFAVTSRLIRLVLAGRFSVCSEELGEGRFRGLAASDGQYAVGEGVFTGRKPHAVYGQEHIGGHRSGPLVAVDERMI